MKLTRFKAKIIAGVFIVSGIATFSLNAASTNPFAQWMDNPLFVKAVSSPMWKITAFAFGLLRAVTFLLIKIFALFINGLSTIIVKILSINALSLFGIDSLYSSYVFPICMAIFGVTILIYAWMYITGKNETITSIFQKIIAIGFILVFLVPAVTTFMNLVGTPALEWATEDFDGGLGTMMIADNVIDVEYTLSSNPSSGESDYGKVYTLTDVVCDGNCDSDSEMNSLWDTYNYEGLSMQLIDQDNIDSEFKNTYIDYDTESNSWTTQELDKGVFDTQKYLFRYNVNWAYLLISLLIMTIALLFASVKFAMIWLWEIPSALVFGPTVVAMSTKSEKLLKVGSEFLNMILGLVVLAFSLGFYVSWMTLLSSTVDSQIVLIVANIAGAGFIISGSQFYTRITGYDPGLNDGLKTIMGINQGMELASRTGGSIANAGKSLITKNKDGNYKGLIPSGIDNMSKMGSAFAGATGLSDLKEGFDTGFGDSNLGTKKDDLDTKIDSFKQNASDKHETFKEGMNGVGESFGETLGGSKSEFDIDSDEINGESTDSTDASNSDNNTENSNTENGGSVPKEENVNEQNNDSNTEVENGGSAPKEESANNQSKDSNTEVENGGKAPKEENVNDQSNDSNTEVENGGNSQNVEEDSVSSNEGMQTNIETGNNDSVNEQIQDNDISTGNQETIANVNENIESSVTQDVNNELNESGSLNDISGNNDSLSNPLDNENINSENESTKIDTNNTRVETPHQNLSSETQANKKFEKGDTIINNNIKIENTFENNDKE